MYKSVNPILICFFDINNCPVTLNINTNQFSVNNNNTYHFTNYEDMESIVKQHLKNKNKEKADEIKLRIIHKMIINMSFDEFQEYWLDKDNHQ